MPEESHIKQLFSSITSAVDDDFEDCEPLKVGASKIKIPPSYLVLPIIIIVLIVSMLTSVIAHYVITFFCLLYPAYMSFKAISKEQEELCKKWLTYWIVFTFATVFDQILQTILFFVPAFYSFKALFFIWLFYPRTDGASIVYEKFLKPYLKALTNSLANRKTE